MTLEQQRQPSNLMDASEDEQLAAAIAASLDNGTGDQDASESADDMDEAMEESKDDEEEEKEEELVPLPEEPAGTWGIHLHISG